MLDSKLSRPHDSPPDNAADVLDERLGQRFLVRKILVDRADRETGFFGDAAGRHGFRLSGLQARKQGSVGVCRVLAEHDWVVDVAAGFSMGRGFFIVLRDAKPASYGGTAGSAAKPRKEFHELDALYLWNFVSYIAVDKPSQPRAGRQGRNMSNIGWKIVA